MTAEATIEISATAQAVLEFVLDLDKYKEVDNKFVRVVSVEGPDEAGRGSAKIWGRMKGLPPLPDRQNFVVERWQRVTFTGAPRQPGRMVFDFTGTFECEPSGDGTRVTHAYEFRFKGPFRVIEKVLGGWLQREIEIEVQELAERL